MKRFEKTVAILLCSLAFFNIRAALDEDGDVVSFVEKLTKEFIEEAHALRWFVGDHNRIKYLTLAKQKQMGTEKVSDLQNEIEFMCIKEAVDQKAVDLETVSDKYDLAILPQLILEGNFNLAMYLSKHGFNPNSSLGYWGQQVIGYEVVKDSQNNVTALQAAVWQENEKLCRVLLAHGATLDEHCVNLAQKRGTQQWLEDQLAVIKANTVTAASLPLQEPNIEMIRTEPEVEETPLVEQVSLEETNMPQSPLIAAAPLPPHESTASSVRQPANQAHLNTPTELPSSQSSSSELPHQLAPEAASFSWANALVATGIVCCTVYLAKLGYEKWKLSKKQTKPA